MTRTFMRTLTPYLAPLVEDALAGARSTVPVAAGIDPVGD